MAVTPPPLVRSIRHRYEQAMWALSILGYLGVASFGFFLAATPPPPIVSTFGPGNPAVWLLAFPFLLGGMWGAAVRASGRGLYENAALAAAGTGYLAYAINAVIALAIREYPSGAALSNAVVVLTFLGWRFLDLEVFALADGAEPHGTVTGWALRHLRRAIR